MRKIVKEKKTKDILFETLKMSPYLVSNKRTELSKIIFKICSQIGSQTMATLEISK